MREETQGLIKKFEQDYGITVDARNHKTYWVITARIPKSRGTLLRVYHARKFIATLNDRGSVLIIPDYQVSERYFVETWGELDTFEGFIKKALARILEDRNTADNGETEGCGTICA